VLIAPMAESKALPVLPLAGHNHVFLAVSGGSDSTALLYLAARQCQFLANSPELTAVTVDHRLRDGSAAEARSVEAMCAALGVRHETLAWEGSKPASGIQDAARNARRNLIAAAAGKAGADAVFTGHTLDDQIETVAMRQKRGPGPGLAGIAPVSFVFSDAGAGEPVAFIRPLLGIGRAALREYLNGHDVAWIDDPSNENTAFERVAIRYDLADLPEERKVELATLQQKAAHERIEASCRIAALLNSHAFAVAPGLIRLDLALANESEADVLAALRVMMAFSSGTAFPAEAAHAIQFLATWQQGIGGTPGRPVRIGLGGVLADIRREGLYLMQEQRRTTPGATPFAGRYRLTGSNPAAKPPQPKADSVPAPASLIRKAASAEPVFDCPNSGATSADEAFRNGRRLRLLINPWPDLVPSFDIPAYNTLAKIMGAVQVDLPLL
jgi:tRNA(Ile)-lysidine synthase